MVIEVVERAARDHADVRLTIRRHGGVRVVPDVRQLGAEKVRNGLAALRRDFDHSCVNLHAVEA
jgi:hypothetical protein